MSKQASVSSGYAQRFDPRATVSGSRKKAKSKGSRNETQQPAEIFDFEEALESGVQAEESAERWALGPKARRFFELALAMYIRAMDLNSSSADAAYNAARVQYLLAISFYLPPQALDNLQQSITLYQYALCKVPPLPDPSSSSSQPSAFTLDILFNLATACLTLSEMLDETGLLLGGDNALSKSSTAHIALAQFQAVARGQQQVLLEQIRQNNLPVDNSLPVSASSSSIPEEEADADMDDGDEADGADTSIFSTSLVTPSSYIEACLAVSNAAWAQLDLQGPLKDVALIEVSAQLALQAISEAEQIRENGQLSPGDEWNERLSELRFARCSCMVTHWAKRAEAAAHSGNLLEENGELSQGLVPLLQNLAFASEELLGGVGVPSEPLLHTQQLCDLGDANMSLARARLRQVNVAAKSQSHSPALSAIAKETWSLLATASKMFLAAYKLLDPSKGASSSAVVLGSSNVVTSTDRTRAAISSSLANVSLLRANTVFSLVIPDVVSPETRIQLLDNARVYARRAVSELGLKWALERQNPSQCSASSIAARDIHLDGGWEVLRAAADAILTTARVVWTRQNFIDKVGPLTTGAKTLDSTAMELEKLSLHNVCLALSRRTENNSAWALALNLRDPSSSSGFGRYLDEIIGEDGEAGLSTDERAFWTSWADTMVPQTSDIPALHAIA